MHINQHLANALHEVHLENARHINRIRITAVGSFLVVIAGLCIIPGTEAHPNWQKTLIPLSIYAIIALLVMLSAEGNPKVLWASRFAIPIVDIPMAWFTLYICLTQWDANVARGVAGVSIGIFLCLLMLSTFTLNRAHLFVSFAMIVLAQHSLEIKAGVGLGGQWVSVLLFATAIWICLFARRSRISLVNKITEETTRRRRLQTYFSPGVGEMLGQQDEDDLAMGKEGEVTVIISDIRGFTALSERLDCRETVKLLNLYHSKMVEAVFQHGGTLDKYLGDGLLAYFNAPIDQTDHAERAVQCALSMNCALASLNTNRSWHGLEELQMGIGIHTGRAIVGDIGAPHRKEFTAIGKAVNIASRLESMTKELGHSVLVSKATADQVTDHVAWIEVGTFPIRGCATPLQLFSPGAAEELAPAEE
jgi:adenylate cyclase